MNQAFPGTEDERTVEDVDRHIKEANVRQQCPMCGDMGGPEYWSKCEAVTCEMRSLASADGGHGVQVPQWVPCRCFDETSRRLCANKDRCSRVEAYSAPASGFGPKLMPQAGGQGVQVPQGWKLAPMEPTLQMKLAVKKALGNHSTDGWWLEDFWEDQYGPAYAAMLAAAPEAPAQTICQRCNGSGDQEYLVGGGPDAHDETGPCSHCGGSGEAPAQAPVPWAVFKQVTTSLAGLLEQVEKFVSNHGEADFETGEALRAIEAAIQFDAQMPTEAPAQAAQPGQGEAPKAAGEPVTYVEARQCDECNHIGINDASTTDSTCSKCGWAGISDEDECPGCKRTETMTASCPKCGGRYAFLADAHINTPPAQASDADIDDAFSVARAALTRPTTLPEVRHILDVLRARIDAARKGEQP